MNIRIHSRTAFPRILEETLFQTYQEGKRSVDFLLLFPVKEREKRLYTGSSQSSFCRTRCQVALWDSAIHGLYQTLTRKEVL